MKILESFAKVSFNLILKDLFQIERDDKYQKNEQKISTPL
jgi:hypothetical protein